MDNIDFGHLLLQFDGRINRAKFWLGFLSIWLIEIVIVALIFIVDIGTFNFVGGLALLALLWPVIAVIVKRFHDRGKSGWWTLIWLIPIVGPIWILIDCGILPGDEGPNEFGPDPLAA